MKMDTPFEKLKSDPATNAQPKSKPVPKEDQEDKAVRRELMSPRNTLTEFKSSPSKSRRLSPPKFAIKKLKVRVERLKLDTHSLKNTQESAAAKKGAQKVVTATKAHQQTNTKLKRCLVRLPRLNLQKLQEDMRLEIERTTEDNTDSQKSTVPVDNGSNKGKKRQSNSGSSSVETWPNRKGKRGSERLASKAKTRRLSSEYADGEREIDECEYIVPNDFPERRLSRTSSANAAEEIILGQNAQQSPVPQFMQHSTPAETEVSSVEQHTSEKPTNEKIGFNDIVSNTPNEGNNVELSPLTRLGSISPAHSTTSLIDLVDSLIQNLADCESRAGNGGNIKDAPETLLESGSKIKDSTQEISPQLFVEDLVHSSINNVADCESRVANGGNTKEVPETLPVSDSKIEDPIEEMPLQLFVEDLVDSSNNNVADCESRAANGGNMKEVSETLLESGSNIKDSIEQMPLQLLVEDDSNLTAN